MSQLTLAFLGTPSVRLDEGPPAAFATRKALALLAYLAVEGGPQRRELLTTLFWPESGSTQARATLRSTLAYLRESLGPAANRLAADRETLRLELAAGDELDVQRLRAAAQATRQLPLALSPAAPTAAASRQDLHSLVTQLQAASQLYRGDFLAGFSLSDAAEFDDWSTVQREAAHRQASTVFEWLAQLQSAGGALAEATATTQRWVSHDPLNETAHRLLMQLHLTADNREAALHAYAACRAVLARELNAEPSSETEALAARIRARPARHAPAATARREALEAASLMEAPLVGRTPEHLELVACFRRARRAQASVAVIEGEPGIGKTRLAREFLAWSAGQGAERLVGRAYESGGQSAYQPLVDALRERLGDLGAPELRALLSDTWLAELSRLLPELSERVPGLPAPLVLAEGEARTRLFEALARLGAGLAASEPLVVSVDDLQWADDATLDSLQHLMRRWRQLHLPALLVLSVRTEDLAVRPALNDWLARLAREADLTRVRLAALSFEDTVLLVQSVGLAEPDRVARQLFADTGGHPFYLIQTLRGMVEAGQLRVGPEGKWLWAAGAVATSTPLGVRELIRSRLARLSPAAQALVSAGAVLGSGFKFERLARVAELEEGVGLAALDELLARGLLRERSDATGQLIFSHDKLREVAYAEASEARRRALHRRALDAMPEAPAADQAPHALAAGLPARARPLLMAAGRDALRLLAAANAVRWLEQARGLLDEHTPPEDRRDLLLELGRAYELQSQWEAARAAFQELLDLATVANLPDLQVMALNRLAAVAARGGFDLATSAALLERAARLGAGQHNPAGQIETELNLAQMSLYRWDVSGLVAHAEQALALARSLAQPELVARCLNMLAYAGTISSEWERMEAQAEEARALYSHLGQRLMVSDNLALISAARTHLGRPRAGLEAGQAAYAIACELENDWAKTNCTFYLAHALHEVADEAEALIIAQAGVAAGRAAGHPPLLAFNLAILGRVLRGQQAWDEALAAHQECRAIGEALHQPLVMEWAHVELCADYAGLGDWSSAHAQALAAAPLRVHYPAVTAFAGQLRWYETEALIRGGDLALARQDLARFDTQVGQRRRYRIAYLRAAAVLAAAEGKPEQPLLRQALALAQELNLPGEAGQIEARLQATFPI